MHTPGRAAALAALALVVSCNDGAKKAPEGSGGGAAAAPADAGPAGADAIARRAASWAAAGAPPLMTCAKDEDCVVVPVIPAEDPCCDRTVTMLSVNRDFLARSESWRAANCSGVRCEPGALPGAQGAPCAYEGRCKAGQCDSACGEVPPPDYRSVLPADAPSRLGCRRDDDCMLAYAPSPVNACCGVDSLLSPISREHLQFVLMWRTMACKDVGCPERQSPTEVLAECAKKVRCVKRACTDTCAR